VGWDFCVVQELLWIQERVFCVLTAISSFVEERGTGPRAGYGEIASPNTNTSHVREKLLWVILMVKLDGNAMS